MKSSPRVLAIIPARGGSRGIPRKNLVDLGGIPLIAHSIRHAHCAKSVTDCVMNSEDEEIREVASEFGAQVMTRPPELAEENGPCKVDELLAWTVREFEKSEGRVDIAVLLYPTSPLRDPSSINEAVAMVAEQEYDSILSVRRDTHYFWKCEGESIFPVNYNPAKRMPRQKEEWNQWVETKAVYAFRRDLLLETGCRLGGRIGYVEMPTWRSADLDTPEDLDIVRHYYETRIAGD
ncbi:MAG: acylneuraminate cytidylyltransferase family protein [Verrucomicrobiales bacterium]|nr:acylneuraminate cytidylyltransferase family protein [Verrucomicrobiales bacterium]